MIASVHLLGAALPILVSTVILGLVVLMVWWLDRYEREPLGVVALAFAWGALAAPLLALAAEIPFRSVMATVHGSFLGSMAAAVMAAPAFEEVAKGAGLFLLIGLSRNVDNSTDGMVYGTAVGLGFAVAENALYGVATAATATASSVALLMTMRTLLSSGIHALSTSVLGGALGAAHLTPSWPRRFLLALAGLTGAVGLHAGWNLALARIRVFGPVSGIVPIVVTAVALELCFVGTFLLATAMDHRILKRELSEEVKLGVLPSWVAEIVPYYRRRVRGAWWPSRQERTVLSRLLTRLAFRKHALRGVVEEEREVAGLEIVHLRKRLRDILGNSTAETLPGRAK